jgi:hypothetical protein
MILSFLLEKYTLRFHSSAKVGESQYRTPLKHAPIKHLVRGAAPWRPQSQGKSWLNLSILSDEKTITLWYSYSEFVEARRQSAIL